MEFLNHLAEAAPSSELLLHLVHVYGLHLVLLCLSAMTVYRREMSCNHCYSEKEPERLACETAWDEMQTEEVLESAGLYCSGSSLLPVMLQILEQFQWNKNCIVQENDPVCIKAKMAAAEALDTIAPTSNDMKMTQANMKKGASINPFEILDNDVHVNILSFLSPQDIAAVECTSKLCQEAALDHSLWRTLWCRDYEWVLRDWEVGKRAALRSKYTSPQHFDKEFYARFQLCWQNYILAGENTFESCLVGLGGHVFDLSFFLTSHPGSPETIMVHAGKDATDFFLNVRHSLGARRLAQSLCVVVDSGRTSNARANEISCALKPTSHARLAATHETNIEIVAPVIECLASPCKARTLQSVRVRFAKEEELAKQAASKAYGHLPLSGEPNVYYDPLLGRWKAWYTDQSLQSIFVDIPHITHSD